jgi:hypothetical protein
MSKVLPFILAVVVGVAFAQAAQRSFSFGISVLNDTVKVGSPIIVKIQLKNISDHDIPWTALPGGDLHGEMIGFRPLVRDAQGKEPSLTKGGRRLFGQTASEEPDLVIDAVGAFAVHPGAVMKTEINLNELYDLRPGKHTIRVWTYDDENKEKVMSNAITLTVVP